METTTRTAAEVELENARLRRALESIAQRVSNDVHDLPVARTVPYNLALGNLLALQGLALAALDAVTTKGGTT